MAEIELKSIFSKLDRAIKKSESGFNKGIIHFMMDRKVEGENSFETSKLELKKAISETKKQCAKIHNQLIKEIEREEENLKVLSSSSLLDCSKTKEIGRASIQSETENYKENINSNIEETSDD